MRGILSVQCVRRWLIDRFSPARRSAFPHSKKPYSDSRAAQRISRSSSDNRNRNTGQDILQTRCTHSERRNPDVALARRNPSEQTHARRYWGIWLDRQRSGLHLHPVTSRLAEL